MTIFSLSHSDTQLLRYFSNRRGLTLLEVVLAAALVGIVGLAFVALYPAANRYLLQSSEFATNQGEAGFAMEHMRRHLLRATGVLNPTVGNSSSSIQFTWQPTLTSNATSSYQLNPADNTLLEFQSNIGAAWEPIARHVVGLTFGHPNKAQVKITLQVQQTNLPGQPTLPTPFELNTTVTLRGVPSPSSP